MAQLLTNACTLTRQGFEYGKTVVIEQGKISAIHDTVDFETSSPGTRDLQGAYLLPGFVDIQVNGGGGVLFNNAPTVDTIRSIGAAHRQFGTTGFLPTLISDDLAKVKLALAATREAIQDKVPGVLGIHLEGPFLNQEKKGHSRSSKISGPRPRGAHPDQLPRGWKNPGHFGPGNHNPGDDRATGWRRRHRLGRPYRGEL